MLPVNSLVNVASASNNWDTIHKLSMQSKFLKSALKSEMDRRLDLLLNTMFKDYMIISKDYPTTPTKKGYWRATKDPRGMKGIFEWTPNMYAKSWRGCYVRVTKMYQTPHRLQISISDCFQSYFPKIALKFAELVKASDTQSNIYVRGMGKSRYG